MENNSSKSLKLARQFLGKEVEIVFDRPLGSKHPKYGLIMTMTNLSLCLRTSR